MALGSNLGDRDVHLEFGLQALTDVSGVEPGMCSPVYETDAVGPGDQRPYLNAVVSVATSLGPEELLEALLDIEERAGRFRRRDLPRWSARSLDLDLLLFGDRRIDEPHLTIPHPRLAERSFVLVPLADLAPDLVHPVLGETIETLVGRASREGVRPWARCLRIAR